MADTPNGDVPPSRPDAAPARPDVERSASSATRKHPSRVGVRAVAIGGVALLALAALLVASREDRSAGLDSTASSGAASVSTRPEPNAPPDLSARNTRDGILLKWDGASGAKEYIVARSGSVVAAVVAPAHRWLDRDVLPTRRYRYEVRATYGSGAASDVAVAAIRVPPAPIRTARLEGVFNVTLTVRSKFGYSSLPAKTTAGWRFLPVCAKGACDVDWSDTVAGSLSSRLDLSGETYGGADTGNFNIVCSGIHASSLLTLTLRVSRAALVDDAWRVTVLDGTMTQHEDAQLGCSPSGATYDVHAVLYR